MTCRTELTDWKNTVRMDFRINCLPEYTASCADVCSGRGGAGQNHISNMIVNKSKKSQWYSQFFPSWSYF